MAYWRMQLHPSDASRAMKYAAESIGAGFIGLDYKEDVGDMRRLPPAAAGSGESDFTDFLKMQPGDLVLVIVHHFPFALVEVAGEYNYIASPEHELGVWFRHFRRIRKDRTQYFADRVTNARSWEQYRMTDTISILKDHSGQSYRLIEEWRHRG